MTSRAEARDPELSKPCRWDNCHAQPGERCTNRRNLPRETSHPGRREDWVIALVACPDCKAPIDTRCIADDGRPRANIHKPRDQAADDAYAKVLEDASRDVPPGGRR
ncbi:zinc finger domain-containing protein [Streptomyces fagopyri]|uniref:zinc finger domain-containing protein n=1 Tax=Streptomyces fagopyri TaxID=2662397 RepID=UPI0038011FAF